MMHMGMASMTSVNYTTQYLYINLLKSELEWTGLPLILIKQYLI